MTSHVPDPLSPEERELAARLARIGPHGEPSPALDARILGAAQTAAARKPDRSRQRRWPAWAGIAATLALALGAVWQLRPVQEVSVELEETPVQLLIRKPAEPTPEPMRPIAPPKATVVPPPPAQVRATKVPSPLPRTAPQAPEPPVVFDEPSPMDVMPPPAAPAPPPSQPAPEATTTAGSRAARAMSAAPASVQAEAAASDAPVSATGRAATVTVTDLPVASDSQLPPVDWIERIRQRRDTGDLASARASLALLRRDYPQLPLPDDVRAIAPPADR
ncbi:hypothetical protein [Novilysobacter erysipheiresistens]|uniref:Uncharacterized protein n=1 Tax=Novilysobacter erysipheiresistens TaxID=1749332 RepID=A0ABU7YWF3_9GAMM